jgi:hypothetical protein
MDDHQYVTGDFAGNAWRAVAKELRRRDPEPPTLIAVYGIDSPALGLELGEGRRIVQPDAPEAQTAPYVVVNGAGVPDDAGTTRLQAVWSYARPRGGTPLTLYQRGITWRGRFYPTPDELRGRLGLPDPEFDALLEREPEVKAWYRATVGGGA